MIKIRAEVNEIHIRKSIEKMNITKSWFFGKKFDKYKNEISNYQNEERRELTICRNINDYKGKLGTILCQHIR